MEDAEQKRACMAYEAHVCRKKERQAIRQEKARRLSISYREGSKATLRLSSRQASAAGVPASKKEVCNGPLSAWCCHLPNCMS